MIVMTGIAITDHTSVVGIIDPQTSSTHWKIARVVNFSSSWPQKQRPSLPPCDSQSLHIYIYIYEKHWSKLHAFDPVQDIQGSLQYLFPTKSLGTNLYPIFICMSPTITQKSPPKNRPSLFFPRTRRALKADPRRCPGDPRDARDALRNSSNAPRPDFKYLRQWV